MREREEADQAASVHAAIERVLEAERAGEASVLAARERAQLGVAAAADAAARIGARARARITALRERCAVALRREIAAIEHGAAPAAADATGDARAIERIVERIAIGLVTDRGRDAAGR
jgi:hypothetical protein